MFLCMVIVQHSQYQRQVDNFSESEDTEDRENLVHHDDADQPKAKVEESDEEPVSQRVL